MIHTSFSSLGETKQEQWGPFYFPFLLLLEVPLVSKSYISCFQFFSLSIFSFNTFAVKGSSIFFEDQPSNHCKCCWPLSFSLLEIDAWLIIPFMMTVYHQFKVRCGTHLADRNLYTAHLGINCLTNLGPMLWKLVRQNKNNLTLSVFKSRIKA